MGISLYLVVTFVVAWDTEMPSLLMVVLVVTEDVFIDTVFAIGLL